ncbi:MAG TPA: hypothetical protein VFY65_21245 [Longimicrobium sp.]|nr:hypothetical protein [Longimicrobium sp.]
MAELEQLLFTLTSFDAFDVLAGPHRTFPEAAPPLASAACAIVTAE